MAVFYTDKTIRAVVRVLEVDAATGERTPDPDNTQVTIRFRREDGTVLATKTSGAGVTNAGDGYYYADAIPDTVGLYQIEFETGGTIQGRDKDSVSVEQF
jgi:hypothetical protein